MNDTLPMIASRYRLACPSPHELGEYHLGLLPQAQTAEIQRHLKSCSLCTQEIAQLKDYLRALAPDVASSPLERLRVFVARRIGGEEQNNDTLVFAPIGVGVRGTGTGPLVFEANDVQVMIDVRDDPEQPGRKSVLGLVNGVNPEGVAIHVWQTETHLTTVTVDNLGNFVIPHLLPGLYELILSGPNVEIHIQALQV